MNVVGRISIFYIYIRVTAVCMKKKNWSNFEECGSEYYATISKSPVHKILAKSDNAF